MDGLDSVELEDSRQPFQVPPSGQGSTSVFWCGDRFIITLLYDSNVPKNLQQLHQPFLHSCSFSKFVKYCEDSCYLVADFGRLALPWDLFRVINYMH